MKFTLENTAGSNVVRGYGSDGIRVGDTQLRGSCVLSANRVIADWPVRSVAQLDADSLAAALAMQPELIVLGTGRTFAFPDLSVQASVQQAGIGFEAMDTGAACRTYNVLVSEGRNVVAALIVDID